MSFFVNPLCQCNRWSPTFSWGLRVIVGVMLSSFSHLSAAVFAKPTVSEIEEVVGLMHFAIGLSFGRQLPRA